MSKTYVSVIDGATKVSSKQTWKNCRCTFKHLIAMGFKPSELAGHHKRCPVGALKDEEKAA